MVITLNGERYELDEPISVAGLLARLEIDPRRVAIERSLSEGGPFRVSWAECLQEGVPVVELLDAGWVFASLDAWMYPNSAAQARLHKLSYRLQQGPK